MSSRKIFIYHKACHLRAIDMSKLRHYFELNNCEITESPRKADTIIFITCAFKKSVEDENFRLIKKLNKYKGELIVAGCLPAMAKRKFKQIFHGRTLITKNLHQIDNLFPGFKVKFSDISDAELTPSPPPSFLNLIVKFFTQFEFSRSFFDNCIKITRYKLRNLFPASKNKIASQYFFRIANGCLQKCSFCSTYRAIGELRSRSLDSCIEEYKNAIKKGYRNFTILADDTGSYGLDINSSFSDLLENMSQVDKELKISWHIMNLSPRWALKYESELLKAIKNKKIVMIECPVQSGNDRILKLMNRGYTRSDITKLFLKYKSANPELKIYTQIIIGFPSEIDAEFMDTLYFLKKINFDNVDLFEYYDGEDTIASRLNNKINGETVKKRLRASVKFLVKEKIQCHYYNKFL